MKRIDLNGARLSLTRLADILQVLSGWCAVRTLIWCDPVNIFESLVWFLYLSFRGQDQQQPWQVMATIDQADIRGSEQHNHDPSGAASDY
jgi:hypothetical protein